MADKITRTVRTIMCDVLVVNTDTRMTEEKRVSIPIVPDKKIFAKVQEAVEEGNIKLATILNSEVKTIRYEMPLETFIAEAKEIEQ